MFLHWWCWRACAHCSWENHTRFDLCTVAVSFHSLWWRWLNGLVITTSLASFCWTSSFPIPGSSLTSVDVSWSYWGSLGGCEHCYFLPPGLFWIFFLIVKLLSPFFPFWASQVLVSSFLLDFKFSFSFSFVYSVTIAIYFPRHLGFLVIWPPACLLLVHVVLYS